MPATGNEPLKLSQFKSWITGKLTGFIAKPAQDGSAGDVLTLGEGGAVVWSQETSGTAFKVVDVEISSTQGFNIATNYSITSDSPLTARIGYVEYPNHIEIRFVRASYDSDRPMRLNSKYDAATLKEKMYFAYPAGNSVLYGSVLSNSQGTKSVNVGAFEVTPSSKLQGYSSSISFNGMLIVGTYSYTHFIDLVFEK